jgi:hypothetical protein
MAPNLERIKKNKETMHKKVLGWVQYRLPSSRETNVLPAEEQIRALSLELQDTIDAFKKANTDRILAENYKEMVAILQEEYYATLDVCDPSLDDLHAMQKALVQQPPRPHSPSRRRRGT